MIKQVRAGQRTEAERKYEWKQNKVKSENIQDTCREVPFLARPKPHILFIYVFVCLFVFAVISKKKSSVSINQRTNK